MRVPKSLYPKKREALPEGVKIRSYKAVSLTPELPLTNWSSKL